MVEVLEAQVAAAVHLVADPGHHPHRPVAVVHLEVAAAHPVVVVSAALVHQALLPVDLHTVVLLQWAVGLVVDISLYLLGGKSSEVPLQRLPKSTLVN